MICVPLRDDTEAFKHRAARLLLMGKCWLSFEDYEIPDLHCGTPAQDRGFFRCYSTVRCRWGGMIVIPEIIPEGAMADWVGDCMPGWIPHGASSGYKKGPSLVYMILLLKAGTKTLTPHYGVSGTRWVGGWVGGPV